MIHFSSFVYSQGHQADVFHTKYGSATLENDFLKLLFYKIKKKSSENYIFLI